MGRFRFRDRKTEDGGTQGGGPKSTRSWSIRFQRSCPPSVLHLKVSRMLDLYAAGGLGPEDERLVMEHVAVCAKCADAVREIAALTASLRAIPFMEPSLKTDEIIANVLSQSPTAAGHAAAHDSPRTHTAESLQGLWWMEYAVLVGGFIASLVFVAPRIWLPICLLRPGPWTLASHMFAMFVASLPVALLWGIGTGVKRLRKGVAFQP